MYMSILDEPRGLRKKYRVVINKGEQTGVPDCLVALVLYAESVAEAQKVAASILPNIRIAYITIDHHATRE